MAITYGDLELGNSLLNLEYELFRTQKILEWIVENNDMRFPDESELDRIRSQALACLQRKYPNTDIQPQAPAHTISFGSLEFIAPDFEGHSIKIQGGIRNSQNPQKVRIRELEQSKEEMSVMIRLDFSVNLHSHGSLRLQWEGGCNEYLHFRDIKSSAQKVIRFGKGKVSEGLQIFIDGADTEAVFLIHSMEIMLS